MSRLAVGCFGQNPSNPLQLRLGRFAGQRADEERLDDRSVCVVMIKQPRNQFRIAPQRVVYRLTVDEVQRL